MLSSAAGRPMVLSTMGLVVGIVLPSRAPFTPIIAVPISLLLMGAALLPGRTFSGGTRRTLCACGALLVLFMALGNQVSHQETGRDYAQSVTPLPDFTRNRAPTVVVGRVDSLIRAGRGGRSSRFSLCVERLRPLGASGPWWPTLAGPVVEEQSPVCRLRALVISPAPLDLIPGDRILFRGSVSPPDGRANPHRRDGRLHLQRQGVHAIARLPRQGGWLLRASTPPGARVRTGIKSRLQALIQHQRHRFDQTLSRHVSGPPLQLMRALLLGDGGALDPEVRRAFSATGTAHLLAISGLHVGLVSLFLYASLCLLISRMFPGLARRIPAQRSAAALTMVGIWLYTAFSGGHIPTIRAAIMVSCHLGGIVLGRAPDPPSSLAAAALLLLLHRPGALHEPSFQLSFGAVLSLMFLLPTLARTRRPFPRGKGPARQVGWLAGRAAILPVVSATASIATIPITALHFGRFTPWAPLVNLAAVPWLTYTLLPILMVSLMTGLLLPAPLAPLTGLLLRLGSRCGEALIWFTGLAHEMTGGDLPSRAPPPAWLLYWYAALLIPLLVGALARSHWLRLPPSPHLLWARRRLPPILRFGSAAVLLALLLGLLGEGRPVPADTLRITFLDVGQGDAAVIHLPGGDTVLLDGGSSTVGPAVAQSVIIPYLHANGVRRLRAVAITHGHPDHCNGLNSVLEQFPVDQLWHPGSEPIGPVEQEALRTAARQGVRLVVPPSGDRPDHQFTPLLLGQWGAARIEALHPIPVEPAFSANDNSLVLMVSMGADRILLVGDLEYEGEELLMELTAAAGVDLRAHLLKAGHHGGRTSTSTRFLERVAPEHVVISVGSDNTYNHPSPAVLKRAQRTGAQMWRTDIDGAITVETRGEGLTIRGQRSVRAPTQARIWPPSPESHEEASRLVRKER